MTSPSTRTTSLDLVGLLTSTDTYSCISYALELGFLILFVDQLGNRNSSYPNPILEVQVLVPVEDVMTSSRNSNGDIGSRKFTKAAYISNSFGSVLGTARDGGTHPFPLYNVDIISRADASANWTKKGR